MSELYSNIRDVSKVSYCFGIPAMFFFLMLLPPFCKRCADPRADKLNKLYHH